MKADDNPPPGLYNPDLSISSILPRAPSATINQDLIPKRPKEVSPSPGQYDGHLRPFGDIPQNINFGSKYSFEPDKNPPPGLYNDSEAKRKLLPKARSAYIYSTLVSPRKKKDISPGPGHYDSYLRQFGDLPQSMTIQGKHSFRPNQNPPPGLYDPTRGLEMTKPRNPSYSQSNARRGQKQVRFADSPDAGQYNPHKEFGSGGPNMRLGTPFKEEKNDNPGPGSYNPELSIIKIKPTARSASINEQIFSAKRLGDNPPHVYDGHLKPFGADVTDRAVWGKRPSDQMNDVPPPGYYDPLDSLTKPSSPNTKIMSESMVTMESLLRFTKGRRDDDHCDHYHDGHGIHLLQQMDILSNPYIVLPRKNKKGSKSLSPVKLRHPEQ